ncbi:cytochrome c biogenesis protein CcsA [Campylobacter sp. RM12640]|uniref:cytochrome c biogenesis protein n=1 Tax=unclassified Campylobacter TaxID=2593542 RepID=UPI001D4509E1|nr:cytochrome c biogenesis protein CcsA [Campylobacter sp. RM12640]MBZ7988790.1 cytochrome c biogenesis protein CcsA [Campylobacter sp. RM12635]MBZ7992784.1 cytochrome c biogenesis protein CcsA [Campylobacter sp. RM9333]
MFLNKFLNLKISLVYMLIFAIFCGVATFIESAKGTSYAMSLVYNAWYFHLIMVLLFLSVIYAIFKYKLYKNISLFLIHISFIFIFIGAVLTHFFGFEGIIHLRVDNKANEIKSTKTELVLKHNDKISKTSNLNEIIKLDNASLRFVDFSNEAGITKVKSDDLNDPSYLKLRFNFDNGYSDVEINYNECVSVANIDFCFNKTSTNYVNFYIKDNEFYINTNQEMKFLNQILSSDFKLKDGIYLLDEFSFSALNYLVHSKDALSMSGGNLQAIRVEFESGISKEKLILALNDNIKINDYDISWKQESLKLDFDIYLKRFNLITHAGSKSAKDYESELLILDNNQKIDVKIAMNKVLDYKGIRYFQHSYDEDLKGTILSANKDLGKTPTYIGYALLFIGCFLNLFSLKTRKYFKALSVVFIIILSPNLKANDFNSHINELNSLIIQDLNDRFLPFYTFSLELCNKIGCPNKNAASEEIFRLITDVTYVNEARLIRVKNPKLREFLNCEKQAKFSDFYDGSSYKLKDEIKKTYAKGEANFNDYDKDLIRVDESVNILYLIFTAELFKIIPDENHLQSPFANNISLDNQKLINEYLSSLVIAKKTNDYSKANEILSKIKNLQNQFDFLPSQAQIKTQIFLSKYDAFYSLCFAYLVLFILSLFVINKNTKIIFYLTLILFLIHLILIGLRGFVAGFTPLTNTYESLIYIALSSVFAGLVFRKNLLLSLCLLFSVATLFTAHLNDINPQITNLMPVLNSPYLSIHVSLIAASYGFFGLSALISFSYLSCVIFKKPYDKANIQIYLANHLGLLLLICGNFLGGIWANESWGRYWGWDSKETWSLISILIYAILVHLKLKSKLLYALLSMWGFGVILMTYFGVNYYLVGKHSYAGEKSNFESPLWLIISVIILIIFSLVAIRRNLK